MNACSCLYIHGRFCESVFVDTSNFSNRPDLSSMWGSTFDDQDEDDKSVAVMKRQFLEEPAISNFTFPQPPLGIQAKDFVSAHFGKDAKNMQFRRGTTTLAFVYEPATANDQGGIVVAVDSRASSGEYISSKSVMKILDIGDHMVATMAGGAADCQFWTRTVAKYCNLFELREKTQITVAAASKYFANVLYNYRGMGLSVGSMIAGYDKRGPQIFKVRFFYCFSFVLLIPFYVSACSLPYAFEIEKM
ncbi:unnamed protein product [Cylicostephanus goldi]|uniref:Proteasome endopeptidase complex n=1 Tax=Cylicostephanus goldi TaxID=71465 RepID=A0A3P6SH37_CYLGO|nr:unnamed protein product [Cylicostephanus goldi]